MLALIGSAGLGLAWGWLVVQLGGARPSTAAGRLSLLLATALLGVVVVALVSWYAALVCLVAAAFALVAHLCWLQQLLASAKASQ